MERSSKVKLAGPKGFPSGHSPVDTSGLTKDGDTYTNDAYGESDVTLNIEIDAGIGKINLDVG